MTLALDAGLAVLVPAEQHPRVSPQRPESVQENTSGPAGVRFWQRRARTDPRRSGGSKRACAQEYQQLRQAMQEQQVNEEFDAFRAGCLARREAGAIRYVSHEEACRRLGIPSR